MTATQAILRAPDASIAEGERTHLKRQVIDAALALRQHAAYAAALERMGLKVTVLPPLPGRPDACFVEDAAIVLPQAVILTRPGAESRADEPAALAPALPQDRPLMLLGQGRLDGGDVLVAGRHVFVGLSTRTDAEGAKALHDIVHAHGYMVHALAVPASLHLKTAATALTDDTLVLNPAWLAEPPPGFRLIEAHPDEPFGANLLFANGRALAQAAAPRTAERVAKAGFAVATTDISEFAKAEAGLTCLSVLIPGAAPA